VKSKKAQDTKETQFQVRWNRECVVEHALTVRWKSRFVTGCCKTMRCKARKSWGMRGTWCTLPWRRMGRHAVGVTADRVFQEPVKERLVQVTRGIHRKIWPFSEQGR